MGRELYIHIPLCCKICFSGRDTRNNLNWYNELRVGSRNTLENVFHASPQC